MNNNFWHLFLEKEAFFILLQTSSKLCRHEEAELIRKKAKEAILKIYYFFDNFDIQLFKQINKSHNLF